MAGKLTLVRHGSTALNDQDRIRGWANVPLNSKGLREADQVAAKLKDTRISRIYSSSLTRAGQTAIAINKIHAAPLTFHQQLRPWNVGDYTAKKTAEVLPKMKALEKPENERIPTPNGESFREFKDRYLPFLQSKMKEAHTTGKHIVLATHYRNLSAAEAWVKKGMPKDHSIDLKTMDNHNFSKPSDTYEVPEEALKKA